MPSPWGGVPTRAHLLTGSVSSFVARRDLRPSHIQQELWDRGHKFHCQQTAQVGLVHLMWPTQKPGNGNQVSGLCLNWWQGAGTSSRGFIPPYTSAERDTSMACGPSCLLPFNTAGAMLLADSSDLTSNQTELDVTDSLFAVMTT